MQRFRGKVAVVTGAGQGAGRAASVLLAGEGSSVVVNDTDSKAAESTVREIGLAGGTAVSDFGDVSTLEGSEGVVAHAVESFGGLDILINARTAMSGPPLLETTAEGFDEVVRHALKGAFMPTRAASVQFRQQRRGGRVITITSDAGLGKAYGVSVAAASEGIIGMSRTVARDLGRYAVTCNAIALSKLSEVGSESAAALAASLCLDSASHVNGIVFGVNDGDIWTYTNPAIERSFHKWGPSSMDEMDQHFPTLFE